MVWIDLPCRVHLTKEGFTLTLAEKFQSIIILAAVFAGISLGSVPEIAQNAGHFILPLLMVMPTGVFLHIPLHRFRDVIQYRGVAGASLMINFVWTPLLAWLLGWLFLGNHPALWVGFLMLMVTPCTDWYLVFTGIAKGNLALSTALLPVNLVLQLVLLPVYILLLAGTVFTLDWVFIVRGAVFVLVLPFLAAFVLRFIIVSCKSDDWLETIFLPEIQPALPDKWAKNHNTDAACISCNKSFLFGMTKGGIYCVAQKKE